MLRILQKLLLTLLLTSFASQASAMFIQPDWFEVTEPGVGTNRYSYSHNDPVNKFDPLGNESMDLTKDQDASDEANAKAAQDALERAERIRKRETFLDKVRAGIGLDNYWEGRAANHISRIGKSWYDRAKGDAATALGVGSVMAGGGALYQGSRAIVKGASVAAAKREVSRQAAIEAAERLGLDLSKVSVTKGMASAKVAITKTLNPQDMKAVAEYMKSQGAKRGQIDTGYLANEKLDDVLNAAVGRGPQRVFGGGKVTRHPSGEASRYTIDYEF